MDPFDGDPLEAAPDSIAQAEAALDERGFEKTDENIFLVAAAIVPGRNMELNEGIRLLNGKPKIVLPLKKKEEPKAEAAAAPQVALTAPVSTVCRVEEDGTTRTFRITVEPPQGVATQTAQPAAVAATASAPVNGGIPVFSPFKGKVELVEIKIKVGDVVKKGQVVAAVEAMKAKHDVRCPSDGRVASIDADLGADIIAGKPIMTIAP
jgi:biotin carboxyl carrier protein